MLRTAARPRSAPAMRGGSATWLGAAPWPFAVVGALAKEPHLGGELRPVERPQHSAAERVHGRGQDEVEEDRREERVEEDEPRGDVVTDHEVEDELAERREDGDDGDGDERRVAAVAAGRLAVAADPVAGDSQDERREPERAEVGGVDDEPGAEAAGGAEDGAAQARDADQS